MNFRGDMNTELFCKGSEEVWNERIRELHNNNEDSGEGSVVSNRDKVEET